VEAGRSSGAAGDHAAAVSWVPLAAHPVGAVIARYAARSFVARDPEGQGLRVHYEARPLAPDERGDATADAPAALRARIAAMQRRAYEVQLAAGDVEDAPDPVEEDPDWPARVHMPVLLAAGERDMPDMQEGVHVLCGRLPHARREFIARAGHLAPLETPEAFRALLLDFLQAA
jgi:pimeloyl-ACP methyl ester carboxylesterase